MITRRGLLQAAGGALALTGAGSVPARSVGAGEQHGETFLSPLLPGGTRAEAVLDSLPGKKPLIKLTYRPPNYEAPLAYLRTAITPNDEFFVRYHLTDIPQVDAGTWKLNLGGEGANGDLQIGLDELKKLPAFEITAVCQCAGNRRGFVQPHATGVQWGSGAMGCARWKGARLKDVLDLVGLKKDAVEIVFDGADGPAIDKTPDFLKSLPVWKAIEETTLVAYEMNGEVLPHWNGFPARIVVPGWSGTYWVKHITGITAVTKPFEGYWMKSAYRIPVGKFPLVQRFISQETAANTPITEMVVNSLVASPADGARVKAGSHTAISGIAWDGGYGISAVEVSADGGKSWTQAALGEDAGRFAFRPWRYDFTAKARGKLPLTARATNKIGQTQTQELIQNPAGYNNNVAQTVTIDVA
jgi:DMSO/TMAO reductase YedYZ molybdopterin-dependent catalytic subunit